MTPSVGPYRIEGELGRGGMGVVYRAVAPDGQRVALKVLGRTAPGTLARFERERRLQATLGEDLGFVPLLASGESAQGPWIAMPLLDGGSLRDRLERDPIPAREAVELVASLADSVGRAHERGLVHRDLKPENVLFSRAGRPLVADLGLAKHFRTDPGASASVALSRSGVMLGTAGYMAPEQMRDARSVGPPADVFALAAILYECLHGEPAFVGDSVLDLLSRVDRGDRAPFRPDLAAPIREVIARSLSPDPTRRPQDGGALARALEAAARAPSRRRGRGGALVALGVVGALLGVAAARGAFRARSVGLPTGTGGVASASPADAGGRLAEPIVRGAAWLRHEGPVFAVGLGVDGRILSAGPDGLRSWDLERRRVEARPLTLLAAGVTSGGRALVVTSEGELRDVPWRTGESRTLATCPAAAEHGVRAYSAASDGSAAFLVDGHGGLWRWRQGSASVSAVTVEGMVDAVLANQDGSRALVGGLFRDGALLVLERERALKLKSRGGDQALALMGGGEAPLAFAPDGALAATANRFSRDLRNGLWVRSVDADVTTARTLEDQPVAAVFGPSGRSLAVLEGADRVVLLAAPRWERGRVLARPPGATRSLAFAEDAGRILLGGEGGAVRVLDLATGATVGPTGEHDGAITALSFEPAGDRLVSADAAGRIVRWSVGSTLAAVNSGQVGKGVQAVCAEGASLVVAAEADDVGRYTWTVGVGPKEALCGSAALRTLVRERGGAALLCARDESVDLWRLDDPRPSGERRPFAKLDLQQLGGDAGPDALARAEGRSGPAGLSFLPRKGLTLDAADLLPGGQVAFLASDSGGHRLGRWVPGVSLDWRPGALTGDVSGATFAGGRVLAATAKDVLVRSALDPSSDWQRLEALPAAASRVALSPRSFAAVALADEVRLYDLATRRRVGARRWPTETGRPTALAFSADERWLAAGTSRGVLLLFAVSP